VLSLSQFHANITMIYRYLVLAGVIFGASLYITPRANAESRTAISFTGYVSSGCRIGKPTDNNVNSGGLNVNCNTGAQISVNSLASNGIAMEETIERFATNGGSHHLLTLNFPAAAQRKIAKLSTKYHPSASSDVDRTIVTVVPY
jgi:hypothetical protein